MARATVNVQSISDASNGGKPVVGTIDASSAIVQWVVPADVGGAVGANVRSYAGGAGLLTAPINLQGSHYDVYSVTGTLVGSVGVTQVTSPWATRPGSTGAIFTVYVASQGGGGSTITGSVTATIPAVVAVTGSVQATQATSPWVVLAGSTGATFSVVASIPAGVSVAGQSSVYATQIGVWSVAAQISSVAAFQGGAWAITGSVAATQVGSAGVYQAGSWSMAITGADSGNVAAPVALSVHSFGGGFLLRTEVTQGSVGVSQLGAPWSVTGSQAVTQAGVWSVSIAQSSVAAFQGGTWNVSATGSMRVTPPNAAVATSRMVIAGSGTLLTALANRQRVLLYNRGTPLTPSSSAVVYVQTSLATGATSATGWPLEFGATMELELGPDVPLCFSTIGSHGSFINSGQTVQVWESA